MNNKKPVLITGVAGFIGFHLAKQLLEDGLKFVGIAKLNILLSSGCYGR